MDLIGGCTDNTWVLAGPNGRVINSIECMYFKGLFLFLLGRELWLTKLVSFYLWVTVLRPSRGGRLTHASAWQRLVVACLHVCRSYIRPGRTWARAPTATFASSRVVVNHSNRENYTVSISPPDFMHIFQLWNGWTNHDDIVRGESMDP